MASRFPMALSVMLFASSAFAVGELPTVNSAKTVSAMDLYGVVPPLKKQVQPKVLYGDNSDLLVPNKPTDDLWSNGNRATENQNMVLPEETLDRGNYIADARPVQVAPIRVNSVRSFEPEKPVFVERKQVEEPKVAEKQEEVAKDLYADAAIPTFIRSAPRFKDIPKIAEPKIREPQKAVSADEDEFAYKEEIPLTKLSPSALKKAFKKTFVTENKHLSTYQINDGFDEISVNSETGTFDSSRDLSEGTDTGIRPLEIKIAFNDDDSALSRDNYNLLTEYAGIVANNPKRAVQVSISERSVRSYDGRKLAARRLAIIEQVLRDSGIIDRRVVPVLSERSDDAFVLRVISNDTFQTLSEKKRDLYGDVTSSKSYRSMTW